MGVDGIVPALLFLREGTGVHNRGCAALVVSEGGWGTASRAFTIYLSIDHHAKKGPDHRLISTS